MAEGDRTSSNSWESWLGGWVQVAKEKSNSALEMVKKDLAEFTCTMQKDTEKAVELTRESLNKDNTAHATNRVKAGLTSFLENISKALVIPPDDDYIPMKVASDGSGLYDRGKARLYAIQLDASTYMDPPQGPEEQYSMWLESFKMEECKGEISELLVSIVEVRALYTKLVPSEVSHAEFWQRYFYRVHQLQCDEARKQALMKRADQARGDSFSWDDDDDDDDDDWSGGEKDDENHSDWEKMPRPAQSQAATEVLTPSQQSEKVQPTTSSEAALALQKEEPIIQKLKGASNTDIVTPQVPKVKITSFSSSEEDGKVRADLDASISAIAAGTNNQQSLPEKLTSREEKLVTFPASSIASQDLQDASGDLDGFQLQKLSPDLWSLHIPGDNASASHLEETGNEQVEAAELEPGSSSDNCRQEVGKVEEGLSSDAAAGGDASFYTGVESRVTTADGACGASDMEPCPEVIQQAESRAGMSSDISAACIDFVHDPLPTLLPHPDTSSPGPSSSAGSQQDSETLQSFACIVNILSESAPEPSKTSPLSTMENASVSFEPTLRQEEVEDQSTSEVGALNATASADQYTHFVNAGENLAATEDIKSPVESSKPTSESENYSSVNKSMEEDGAKEIDMRVKGDMVVVGDRGSPSSSESSEHKETGIEDDWEQDFDIEVTEEDLKAAEDIAKRLGENSNADDDDWENWE